MRKSSTQRPISVWDHGARCSQVGERTRDWLNSLRWEETMLISLSTTTERFVKGPLVHRDESCTLYTPAKELRIYSAT